MHPRHNLTKTNPKNIENKIKKYLINIKKKIILDYPKTQAERHQLALWEESQEFTILGVIEVFTTDIQGYAAQVIVCDRLSNPPEIVAQLEKLNIFDIPYFFDWYFLSPSDYFEIKRYVERLNYLRLLIIEYLRNL
ncbi:hypothetical protein AM228_06905 [Planktothricoides sp. SR001]|nr:hypothetical protein AM228_06905 [Planktothricoides sp. SR001]